MPPLSLSRRAPRLLLALALALGVLLPAANAGAVTLTQGITGTLSGAGVGAMAGALEVDPLDPTVQLTGGYTISGDYLPGDCMSPCRYYETDTDGTFNVPLPAGEYWVRFVSTGWAREWSGDSPTRAGATKVVVTADSFTPLAAELTHGGTISGTIAQAEGDDDGLIEAWAADDTFAGGYFLMGIGSTDADGHYYIPNLPAGSYRVHFFTWDTKLEGWWQGQTTRGASTPVSVTEATTTSSISPTLAPFGSLTGRVTRSADGTGVQGAVVDLFQETGPGHWSQPSGGSTYTAADGTYTLPMRSGTYRVRFYGAEGLKGEYWNNAADYKTGQDVTVAINQQTTGVDVALEPTAMVNTGAPFLSGTERVGSKLTAYDGAWYPSGAAFSYQWSRAGNPVAGATGKTYLLGVADLGKSITVRVTADGADQLPTSIFDTSGVIAPGVLRLTEPAALLGRARVGNYLAAVAPKSAPAAIVTYRWFRDGRRIYSATGHRHKLTAADRGAFISVRITLRKPGYTTFVRTLRKRTPVR